MLYLYHSNRLDVLKDLLVELLRLDPLKNPLQNEQILVQSPGMAQWLRLQLAEGLGIAAALEFPLPASFLWKMYTRVLPDVPSRSAFNKEAMSWKIMTLLPEMIDQDGFEPLQHYLAEDEDGIRAFQLAGKIADIFDQYLVYRPEWINDWEQNPEFMGVAEDQAWQPKLWRELVKKTAELQQSPWHRANMHHRFISELTDNDHKHHLPERLFVFGISALPPHFVESLAAMATQTEIHLLAMNPCQHYWGDERDPKYLLKLAARKFQENTMAKAVSGDNHAGEHWLDNLDTSGNPLLGSMGKLGRDYFHQLHTLDGFDVDVFVEDHQNNLLHQIQQDILHLNNRPQSPEKLEADPSLQFHSCYSPLREVEVLHDRLLDMFANYPELTPRDIVVMLPDIDSYSPWIQAVFGSIPRDDKRFIPFSISDRSAQNEHPILTSLLHLLELDKSRCTAPELLELLEVPAIQKKFQFSETDHEILRRWVNESGIRWGLDAKHQQQFDLPELNGNTWLFGLRRMLMGYAMPEASGVQHNILPFDGVQGMEAILAGQLASFVEQAEYLVQHLAQERTIEQWVGFINEVLDCFYDPDENDEYALKVVRDALDRLHEQLTDADHRAPLSREIMFSYLSERLSSERSSQRFLAGQVNFCTLMPMRSIPFKVVCLLGMSDGAYPRTIAPAGFDLIAQNSRRGDRSRREDDRYLFLEALLSAQQTLYISFVGHRIQDGTERVPSVLVTELLDYCEQGFKLKSDELMTEHPLQAFSPSQFETSSELFSFAHEWLPAAAGKGAKPEPFISDDEQHILSEPELPETIELSELLRFYKNASSYFFKRRLKVFFDGQDEALEDNEPFAPGELEGYDLQQELLDSLVNQEPESLLRNRLVAKGCLPHAAFGELWLDEKIESVEPLSEVVRSLCDDNPEDIELNETLAELHDNRKLKLTGWLKNCHAPGLVHYRPAKSLKGKDVISAWIEHLCLCLKKEDKSTYLAGLTETYRFTPLAFVDARKHLMTLIEYYLKGLIEPQAWFPQTAYKWLLKKASKKPDNPMKEALHHFNGGFDNKPRGEKLDPYVARIFPELEPVQTQFEQLSDKILQPALNHREKVKL